jgi:hypothetical protein
LSLPIFERVYHRRRKRKGLSDGKHKFYGWKDMRKFHRSEFRAKCRLYNHLVVRGFQDEADNLSIHPTRKLSWDWWY